VRILILGGTGEARALAAGLVARGTDVISSLAGRVREPRLPAGRVRIGGFGGADGLAAFLKEEGITHVIDATHPFAGTITANAARATGETGVPRLVLRRPEWDADPSWEPVADIHEAAALVRNWPGASVPAVHDGPAVTAVLEGPTAAAAVRGSPGEVVFLTTGRRDLAAFSDDREHRFLVRTVDPPDGPVPSRTTLILDRGPYTVAGETGLMRDHGIGLLITKNSGGPLTAAKLEAARDLGVHVIVVQRPPLPPGSVTVPTVVEALRWIPGS
jgi:precorrin-6A/cobalt-precorrin-6A reductase